MANFFGSSSSQEEPRSVLLPSGILDASLMSETSWASDCFIGQAFSNKLQAYMIGYVNSIASEYAVSS